MTVEERLAALERTVRRQRRIGAALALVILAAAVTAFRTDGEDVVRTRGFELLDRKGQVVVKMEALDKGGADVTLRNADGKAVAQLSSGGVFGDRDGSLTLSNIDGDRTVALGTNSAGSGALTLIGPGGLFPSVVALEADKVKGGRLAIFPVKGKPNKTYTIP